MMGDETVHGCCPYERCGCDLVIPGSGWWRCPECHLPFHVELLTGKIQKAHDAGVFFLKVSGVEYAMKRFDGVKHGNSD